MSDAQSSRMSDIQSLSILTTLNDLDQLESDDDFSHLTSQSSAASSSSHSSTQSPLEQQNPPHSIKNIHTESLKKVSREETKNQEFISASRLRAQRNIRQATQPREEINVIPKVAMYRALFWCVYLVVGVLFYALTEDWSVLDALYFISLSGQWSPSISVSSSLILFFSVSYWSERFVS
jgi:hypothetical protein